MDGAAIILAILALLGNVVQGYFQYAAKKGSATRDDFEAITHKYEELNQLYESAVKDMKKRLDTANETIDKLTKKVRDLQRSLKEEFDIRRKLEIRLSELEEGQQ
jgi:predicted RNase H-like nuclease (RuvC/YqgF family)